MTKQEFINKIDETCETLNIPLSYNIEHGLKIINDSIDVDKVNISFQSENLTHDNVLKLSNELFTDPFIPEFIEDVYTKHNDNINRVWFGIANESKELYFEMTTPDDPTKKHRRSSYGVSYDEGEGLIHSYKPFSLEKESYSKRIIDTFIEYIEKDNDLNKYRDILFDMIGGGGAVKDNKYFYLVVFKELQQDDLISCLKLLCKKTILNNDQLIDDWFEKYKDGTLTFLSYRLEGNKITSLNLYIKQ
jgi:hypothetical protein